MPTKHKRHAITETPPVKEALDKLRAELNGERLDLAELVIMGAREKTGRLRVDSEHAMRLRKELADKIRRGDDLGMDIEAADEVKRIGWARPI